MEDNLARKDGEARREERRRTTRAAVREEPETARPRKLKVAGTVLASRDAAGRVTAAKLSAADGWADYEIILDEKGRRMALELDGLDVLVTGTVVEHDDWRTLRVRRVRRARDKAT